MRLYFSCLLVMTLVSGLHAQERLEPRKSSLVRGQVLQEGGVLPLGLTVEVVGLGSHVTVERSPVAADGSFEFPNVEAGEYEVRITNLRGDIIQQEFRRIGSTGEQLRLQLPEQMMASHASGTISVQKLLHPIPPKADKEFRRSQKAFQAGDTQKSIEHLEKAIQIHPDYMAAHNNLGARYMALSEYGKAAKEFQKTVALDPESAKGYSNLSLALIALRRYPEAEAAARRAAQLDPHDIPAHYALGWILGAQGKNMPEALEHLRRAVEKYPRARLMLADFFARQGAIDQAAAQLREYLKSGNPQNRQEVEAWLAQLAHNHTP